MTTSSSTLLHGRIYGNDILRFSYYTVGGSLLCLSEDDRIDLGRSSHQLAQDQLGEGRVVPLESPMSLRIVRPLRRGGA